jgi:hypothetical protein
MKNSCTNPEFKKGAERIIERAARVANRLGARRWKEYKALKRRKALNSGGEDWAGPSGSATFCKSAEI